MMQRGYVLASVLLVLAVLSIVVYASSRDSAMESREAADAFRAVRAEYVAEAGFAHALWKMRRSTPPFTAMGATAFDGASYQVDLPAQSASAATIVASGSTTDGSLRRVARSVDVTACNTAQSMTIRVKPGGIDTTLDSDQPTFNYGRAGYLVVGKSWTGGTNSQSHALLRFDLSRFPPGASIDSAALSVYATTVTGSAALVVNVHKLTATWLEGSGTGQAVPGANWTSNGTVAWTQPGGDYDPTILASATLAANNTWYSWTVTDLVRAWVAGTAANHGFLLRRNTTGNVIAYLADGEWLSASSRPTLTIAYRFPCS